MEPFFGVKLEKSTARVIAKARATSKKAEEKASQHNIFCITRKKWTAKIISYPSKLHRFRS
jgi:hypothetical protein